MFTRESSPGISLVFIIKQDISLSKRFVLKTSDEVMYDPFTNAFC